MKQKLAIYAGLLAVGLAGSAPAVAQAYPPTGTLPPYEVLALVRSTGLEPVSRPVRHGPAYVLHAVNPAGREVRVVVDARTGAHRPGDSVGADAQRRRAGSAAVAATLRASAGRDRCGAGRLRPEFADRRPGNRC